MYRFLLSPRWLGWLAAALALAAVMTLLGSWQLSRYQERSATNARIDAADVAQPSPLRDVLAAPAAGEPVGPPVPAGAEWAMVTATGRFDPDHEVLVRARTVQGRVGFEVLTPLVLADGTAVLVDRGWVPPHPDGTAVRPDVPPAPTGEVPVVGRLRPGEGSAPVTQIDGSLQTRRISPAAIVPHLPHPLYGGYLLLREPADPQLTPIPVRHENAWLNGGYAVQWWIFAGMVLVGYWWFARREAHQLNREAHGLRQPPAGSAAEEENGGRYASQPAGASRPPTASGGAP